MRYWRGSAKAARTDRPRHSAKQATSIGHRRRASCLRRYARRCRRSRGAARCRMRGAVSGLAMDSRIAYAGCTLDRATHLRADAGGLAERLRAPSTRIVPVWRDRSLIAGGERPRLLALAEEAAAIAVSLAYEVVLLGVDEEGAAYFACDLSHQEEERLAVIGDGAAFQDLGRAVTALAANEAALLAYARALAHWHRRHRFCGVATLARQGG